MQTVAEQNADALVTRFRIGAIRGASTAEIQKLLARFAERRIQEGLRVAGVIEEPAGGVDCGVCDSLILRERPAARSFRLRKTSGQDRAPASSIPPGLRRAARLSWPPSSGARMPWC